MFLRYRLCVVDSSYGVLAHTFTWFSWIHHLALGVHTITRRQNIAESAMLCHTVGVARTHARVRACNHRYYTLVYNIYGEIARDNEAQ